MIRRWRWRRRVGLLTLAVLLSLLGMADHRGWLLVRDADDLTTYHGRTAPVDRVIDGDTLDVALPDPFHGSPVTRVRLWGIDCPEESYMGKPAQPLAKQATELTHNLAVTQTVLLRLESQRTRDVFGRVLAHVELSDGRSLSEELLAAGLARADDRWPHLMLTRFAQLEYAAKRRRVGIWSLPPTKTGG